MPASVPALVEKEMLLWARKTSALTPEDAAKKLGISVPTLIAWEDGTKPPTVAQLRTAARVYKRPLAVFYLPAPPAHFTPLRDFRQLPGSTAGIGPQLAFAIRRAHEVRGIALDLAEELNDEIPPFPITASLGTPPADLASRLRAHLGVPLEEQTKQRDPRKAFNMWREAFEASGLFVFLFPEPPPAHNAVPVTEARGFSISNGVLPLVAVNAKDAFTGRVFTMFHELVHIALHGTGLCDLINPSQLPPEERKVEVYCNRVAAETLVPKEDFLLRASRGRSVNWTDAEIEDLSRRYSVSREAIVRRLLELDLTTDAFYKDKREQYRKEAEAAERAAVPPDDFKINMPMLVLRSVGRRYASAVMRAIQEGILTVSSASSVLGVKAKHLAKIEKSLHGKAM